MNTARPSFHIAFCIDDVYCRAMGATITSIVANNPGQHFTFHVLALTLSDENVARLKQLEQMYPVSTEVHLLDPARFSQFSDLLRNSYYSLSIFLRMVLPSVVQAHTDRVLYMDADILCVGKLDELIDLDLAEPAAAVTDFELTVRRRTKALGMKSGKYFNGGVMLMNIPRWEADRISEQAIDVLVTRKSEMHYNDQDALNVALEGRVRYVSPKWNYLYNLVDDLQVNRTRFGSLARARIVHFAGAVKPWAGWTGHEASELFKRYHAMSPWSDLPLDAGPTNTKETRMLSRFLLRQGKPLQSFAWYMRYLKKRRARRA